MSPHSTEIEKEIQKANKSVRAYCGNNFWFEYSYKEGCYELWEQRGPMRQLVIPLNIPNRKPEIGDMGLYLAYNFVRHRRKNRDEDFHKYKLYKQWTKPDEYVNPYKETSGEWKDTSPKIDYKKAKVSVSNLSTEGQPF